MDTVRYKLGQLQVGLPMVVAIVVASESVIALSLQHADRKTIVRPSCHWISAYFDNASTIYCVE